MTMSTTTASLMAQQKAKLGREWNDIRAARLVKSLPTHTKRKYQMKARLPSFAGEIARDILEVVPADLGKEVRLDRLEDRIKTQLKARSFESMRECFSLREELRRLNKELKRNHEQLEDALTEVRDLKVELQALHRILKLKSSASPALSSSP